MKKDESWEWRTKGLGYFEYCFCGCNLTGEEVFLLKLDPDKTHNEREVSIAWATYNQRLAIGVLY